MISRRGFFGMVAGLASAPVLNPLEKFLPQTCTTYLLGDAALVSYSVRYTMSLPPPATMRIRKVLPGEKYFRCGGGEMGTLYWSKEKS